MKILISGSSGLIGSALASHLSRRGDTVVRLVRRELHGSVDTCFWDPSGNILKVSDVEGFDSVVHLAGENLASRRWSKFGMAVIRESRVGSTRLLCTRLAELEHPPKVLISASAIGIYGSRGDEVLTEESPIGEGFLAELGQAWEDAARPAIEAGIRVVFPRFGIVLSARGGALKKMLPPFRFGMGGPLGNGRQFWSWIAIDDAISALCHLLSRDVLRGPVNLVAPQPVSNSEFTRTLGNVLSRPAVIPVPPFILRLALGRMADEALLSSSRVVPSVLKKSGFSFLYPELRSAFQSCLKNQIDP
ncbi:MAG: TIGR01777 family oxidoreductase [Verrucomicrobia bacterium]|nr:TIGR01777 family oxidoreductase [Verrucomicrobiota bacterium]